MAPHVRREGRMTRRGSPADTRRCRLTRAGWAVILLVVLSVAVEAQASVAAQFGRELGGSGSGEGLTQVPGGIFDSFGRSGPDAFGRDVSVAVGPDGQPVVAYIDDHLDSGFPFRGIRVRKWNGSVWQPLGLALNSAI